MLGHRAAEMPSDRLLEHGIGEDGTCHTVPILHVTPSPLGDTPLLKRPSGVLIPIERQPGALGCLLCRQCLTTADHGSADFATRDHFKQPIDAPLRHVPAGMSVNEPPR